MVFRTIIGIYVITSYVFYVFLQNPKNVSCNVFVVFHTSLKVTDLGNN